MNVDGGCPACGEPLQEAPLCPGCGADLAPMQLTLRRHAGELAAAQAELQAGRYRAALARLEEAQRLCPVGPALRLLRGLALYGAGRPSAARADLLGTPAGDRLLAPEAPAWAAERRYQAARAQAEAGDLSAACATLLSGPASGDGLVLFALLCIRLDDGGGGGERRRAREALLLALAADPSNSHAAALLGL